MTEIVHQAFWDCLHEQLNSDPPNYNHAVILLHEVKTVSVLIQKKKKSRTPVAEEEGLLRPLTSFILTCCLQCAQQEKKTYNVWQR